jgi:hypothetical protein
MKEKSAGYHLPLKFLIFYILLVFVCFYFALHFYAYIPPVPPETAFPSPSASNQLPTSAPLGIWDFNPYFARAHLKSLTGMGDRVAGSYENEILTPELLAKHVSEVRERMEARGNPLLIESEFLRLPDGAFQLDFIHPFLSTYEQLGMYLVRLRPAGNTADSPTLLINCHYDSVVGSPGTERHRTIASISFPTFSIYT